MKRTLTTSLLVLAAAALTASCGSEDPKDQPLPSSAAASSPAPANSTNGSPSTPPAEPVNEFPQTYLQGCAMGQELMEYEERSAEVFGEEFDPQASADEWVLWLQSPEAQQLARDSGDVPWSDASPQERDNLERGIRDAAAGQC